MKTVGEFIHNWLPAIIYIAVLALLVMVCTWERKKQ